MRKLMIAAALFVGASSAAAGPGHALPERYQSPNAKSQPKPVAVMGYWDKSCAALMGDVGETQKTATALYVLGVWSGLNLGERKSVGEHTDADGIMGEMAIECQAQPSELILNAVMRVRKKLEAEGR